MNIEYSPYSNLSQLSDDSDIDKLFLNGIDFLESKELDRQIAVLSNQITEQNSHLLMKKALKPKKLFGERCEKDIKDFLTYNWKLYPNSKPL